MKIIKICLVFGLFTSLSSYAATEKKTLKVVGSTFYKVFEKDKEGNFKGLAIDILNKIAEQTNVKFEYDILPWKRAILEVSKQSADLLIGPYLSEERQKTMNYVEVPFYTDWMVFYVTEDSRFRWDRKFNEIHGKSIVSVSGWAYGRDFDSTRSKIQLTEVDSLESGFKMLTSKRVEMFAVNERNAAGFLASNKDITKIKKVDVPIDFMQGYFAFSKKEDLRKYKKDFQRKLSDFQRKGFIKKWNQALGLKYDPK